MACCLYRENFVSAEDDGRYMSDMNEHIHKLVCAFDWIMSLWKSLAINKFYLQSPIWNCQ